MSYQDDTINKKPMYTTNGPIRGCCGHSHQTIRTAHKCLRRDQSGCAAQGGYSDRRIMRRDGAALSEDEIREIAFWREGCPLHVRSLVPAALDRTVTATMHEPVTARDFNSLSVPLRDAVATVIENLIDACRGHGHRDTADFLAGILDAYEAVPLRPMAAQSAAYRAGYFYAAGEG